MNKQAGNAPDRAVALVTCGEVPDLDPDDRPVLDLLHRRGVRAEAAVWDDPEVDWAGYDLAVLRSTWDYPRRRDEFLTWAENVPRLANPGSIAAWNSDKRYLVDLEAAGVPVVHSTFVGPDDTLTFPTGHAFVVKPTVSAGSLDTARFRPDSPAELDQARCLVEQIHVSGRTAMIQPYLGRVDTEGETDLILFDGRFSHAVTKDAILDGPEAATDVLFVEEHISASDVSPAQIDVARLVVDAVTARAGDGRAPLYVRVDLLPGPDGAPMVLEVELVEPSLFLWTAPGADDRMVDAIVDRLVAP